MTLSVRPVAPVFMRLDATNTWQVSPSNSLDIAADRADGGVRLGSARSRPIPFTELGGTFGGLTLPTGLAIGPDGRLFLADPGGHRILSYFPPDQAFKPLWQPAPPPGQEGAPTNAYDLFQPRGVAFSPAGDLVVADTGHGRVMLYTWPRLQPRHIVELPEGEPWDLAYDSGGNLYVADPVAGRIWRYDRLWRLDDSYRGGEGVLTHPRHLAIDNLDQLFVLDEGRGEIIPLDDLGRLLTEFDPEQLLDHTFPQPLRLEGETLYLPQENRPDCPALALPGIEIDRSGRLHGIGAMLVARPRGVRYPRTGRYVSLALDSNILSCSWHRLLLDADLPEATNITIRTLTSATVLDPERIKELPLSRWSVPITINPGNLPEALVQSEPGRYLWLQLDLGGGGETTPLVRSITLLAPRQSSLNFLPPVFRENAVSASFLDRFLSYFDTIFAEIETQINDFARYLDPDSVPGGDFLSWLGSWLDLTFLSNWPDATRRAFIRRAIELYKRRGTIGGLQEVLQLHTGLQAPQPVIIEHFRLRDYNARRENGAADLPDGTLYLAGQPLQPDSHEIAHHFTILLPAAAVPNNDALTTLLLLIEAHKPAHTKCLIRLVRPGARIGCQSTVGIDTLIGQYPSDPLGESLLGQSAGLTSSEENRMKIGSTYML